MIGLYYIYRIKVDRTKQLIRLLISNYNTTYIDSSISWSFDYLRDKLYRKLKYLALVYAKSKFIDGEEYFLYNRIAFFKLRGFDSFLDLIENGKIHIQFNARSIYSNGKHKIHDHGTAFKIHERDVQLLFY